MLGSIRLVRVTLTSLALCAGSGSISLPASGAADEPAKQASAPASRPKIKAAGKDGASTPGSARPAENAANLPGLSSASPATIRRFLSFRFVPRPWMIDGGSRPCGFIARPAHWKISAPGPTR